MINPTAPLKLDILEKVILQLKEGFQEFTKSPNHKLLRDGVIQRFEYTYEISWKTLKRFLELNMPNPELLDGMAFSMLIRTGWEQSLLKSSWDVWRKYREARNETTHTYDEDKAKECAPLSRNF